MKTSDFDYNLPPENIAQTPVEPRDSSRLLVLDRAHSRIEHKHFYDIGDYLKPGDLLVINQTRVIPARIFATKDTGGKIEILLLRKHSDDTWEALVGGKRINAGRRLFINDGPEAVIRETLEGSRRLIQFTTGLDSYLEKIGHMPLPPYIHTPLANPERYQTVYSRQPGSAAAPTAGLHFTPELLSGIQARGVNVARLTLHVGLDTFAPVNEEDPLQHQIHTEWCEMEPDTANLINKVRANSGRIIAVGTTTVRTLESAARSAGSGDTVAPFSGPTDLFILPGYTFKAVDLMVTNFHLPRSTLLMLVSAFAGRELILNSYQTALEHGYRFYSFGDAMIIL